MNKVENRLFEAPATISETIYKYLKEAIISGEIKPEQRIQEKEIAGLFNISTTPVREAFRRLSAEKFLTIDARREVIVTPTSMGEIRELFEVVTILDLFATKKALNNLSPEMVGQLKQMTQELGETYQQKQILPYVKKNLEIHFKIWEHCRNKFLQQTLIDYGEKFAFYSNQFFLLLPDPDAYFEKSYNDHLRLIRAIENKDETQVENILVSHWGKGFFGDERRQG